SPADAAAAITILFKTAILVNGFNLSADEVSYLQENGSDFSAPDNSGTDQPLDFNKLTLGHWQRLRDYSDLRNNLPRTDTTLLDLFKWASQPAADPNKLGERIAAATAWKQDSIDKLIAPDANDPRDHFDLDHPEAFRNEINLLKLRQAIK